MELTLSPIVADRHTDDLRLTLLTMDSPLERVKGQVLPAGASRVPDGLRRQERSPHA